MTNLRGLILVGGIARTDRQPLKLIVVAICFCVAAWTESTPNFVELTQKAQAGDANSQVQLGIAYTKGDGTQVNDSQAVQWFRKAAEQGNASGEYLLAEMYALGHGVGKDYKKAATWMEKAADQGDVRALCNLGAMYLDGLGVKRDEKKAFKLTQDAAGKGFAAAQFSLGRMYARGLGTETDPRKAMLWYSKAADQGDAPALNHLAWLLATTSDLSVRDTARAVQLATLAVAQSGEANSDYWDTLASAYFADARYEKALEAEQKALALRPHDGGYQQAVANYQDVVADARNLPRPLDTGEVTRKERGVSPPKVVYSPDPEPSGKKATGTVVLSLIVGADGKPRDIAILRPADPELDQKAADAVRRWVFKPALKGGQPVSVKVDVEVNFQHY